MTDEIREILSFAQQIVVRKPCSENDVAYHVLAPLLEASGWPKSEIYFECRAGEKTPDIALRPNATGMTALTVEAKAPSVWVGPYEQGQYVSRKRTEPRRNDIPYQVLQQMISHRHCHAWLSNGRVFSLFTFRMERDDWDTLLCVYSADIRRLLESNAVLSKFWSYLSRETYCNKKKFTSLQTRCKALMAKIPAANLTSEGGSALPNDWCKKFERWAEHYGRADQSDGFQAFKELCSSELLPNQQRVIYEVMRFCKTISSRLPGWKLEFQKKKNVVPSVYPNWRPENSGFPYLFQITTSGGLAGTVWPNASEAEFEKETENMPIERFRKLKLKLKEQLGSRKFYEPGIRKFVEGVCIQAEAELLKGGLTLSTLRST